MTPPRTTPGARERVLEAAERLFYAEGIRAVGIDRVIAEAGVAKMSLYNHFKSKDELVLAMLARREDSIETFFRETMARQRKRDALDAFFATLRTWFDSKGFRGCAFINTAVEMAEVNHPATEFAARHKESFHRMLEEAVTESGGSAARRFTPAIALLVEGAIVMAQMTGSSKPADVARKAARALVASVE